MGTGKRDTVACNADEREIVKFGGSLGVRLNVVFEGGLFEQISRQNAPTTNSEETFDINTGYYSRVLSFAAAPGIIGVMQLSQFLIAQRIVYPQVAGTAVGLIVLTLFLDRENVFGFEGGFFQVLRTLSYWPTVFATYATLFTIILVHFCAVRRNNDVPRVGLDIMPVMTWDRITTFTELYIPAYMSSESDYWGLPVLVYIARSIMGDAGAHAFRCTYR